MHVIFTDLDGTLLDHDTYAWQPARPMLEHLDERGIPWVMVTSKTRAEVEYWREALGNRHPFIVENGGAAFLPKGYFPFQVPGAAERGPYLALEWGVPYARLTQALAAASHSSGCPVRGFHQMSPQEVSRACDLSAEQAALATQREYDEPFQLPDESRSAELTAEIERQGLSWTRGGRFWHIFGSCDKGRAVSVLAGLYQRAHRCVTTVGLGDGLNDVPLLEAVHHPVAVRSPFASRIKALVPGAMVTARPGPEGWREALEQILRE